MTTRLSGSSFLRRPVPPSLPRQHRATGTDIPDTDSSDLERFVTVQAPVFATVLGEPKAGQKRCHWMWFVFPQLRGLGHSAMAMRYGIGSFDEARAYLAHPLLGPRLRECTRVLGGPCG